MDSPWHVPLPLEEYATDRVVVYFFGGRWVPIKFCSLFKAITLYHQSLLEGKEIFLFPPDLDPNQFSDSLNL